MAKNDPLPEKYKIALQLLSEGNLSYKDIAKASKIPEGFFYDLVEGKAKNCGTIQEKFTVEYERITREIDKEIKKLAKNCRKKTLYLLDNYLSKHKDIAKKDRSTVAALVSIANGLSKVTPNVEIGSFSYMKGLSPEDIYNEFKRLSGLASDRGAIQGSTIGGAAEIPLRPGSGSATPEESEDSILRTEPEA